MVGISDVLTIKMTWQLWSGDFSRRKKTEVEGVTSSTETVKEEVNTGSSWSWSSTYLSRLLSLLNPQTHPLVVETHSEQHQLCKATKGFIFSSSQHIKYWNRVYKTWKFYIKLGTVWEEFTYGKPNFLCPILHPPSSL